MNSFLARVRLSIFIKLSSCYPEINATTATRKEFFYFFLTRFEMLTQFSLIKKRIALTLISSAVDSALISLPLMFFPGICMNPKKKNVSAGWFLCPQVPAEEFSFPVGDPGVVAATSDFSRRLFRLSSSPSPGPSARERVSCSTSSWSTSMRCRSLLPVRSVMS